MHSRSALVRVGGILALASAACLARAASPAVVINEALYDAVSTDTGREWVEFFNAGSVPVDLTGWRIERGGATFASVFTFPAGAAIAPGGFLTVGESLVPDVDFTATLAFENGGSATDGIRLVDNKGVVVDVLLYDAPNTNALGDETGTPGASFAPDVAEGHSLARVPDGADTNQNAIDVVDVSAPTLGSSNVLPTPTPTPSPTLTPTPTPTSSATPRPPPAGVVVNEALPNPVGSDSMGELIELFNTSSVVVDFGGAQLDDADGGSAFYIIPDGTSITGGGYLSFPRSETGLALNNDGDRARLLAADGSLVSELVFGASPAEGAAWARRTDGSADWTTTPTAGGANVFTPLPTAEPETDGGSLFPKPTARTSPTPTPLRVPLTVSLLEVRALPHGTRVRVTGAVSAPPNILGRGVFYLAGSGIQVFVSGSDLLGLVLGDRVSVTGTISTIRNELRIRTTVADVQRVGVAEPPEPIAVSTGSLGESLEGALVRVHGNIIRLSGNTFELDDGSGVARVLIKKTTGWRRPSLSRGQRVSVVGIVSQSGDLYRILPRLRTDIVAEGEVAGSTTTRRVVVAGDGSLGLSGVHRNQNPVTTEPVVEERRSPSEEASDARPVSPPQPAPPADLPLPTKIAWGSAALVGIARLVLRRA